MRFITSAVAAGLALTATAFAQSYGDADTILIDDFFGTVELTLSGDGDVTIAKSGPNASEVSVGGRSTAEIRGDREIDHRDWQRRYQQQRGNWGRTARDEDPRFEQLLEDRPTLTISAPEGTALIVRGSAIKLRAEGDAGDVEFDNNIHTLVWLGDMENGDLEVHGSGYLKAGNVAGMLDASVHGSGDLIVGNAREAEMSVHGSGDLRAKNIGGELEASVHGSGDLQVERVAGPLEASVHGSGDLAVRSVAGGLDSSVHGSGDLKIGEVDGGDIDAQVHGSGDVTIREGDVRRVMVNIHGSGEFSFGGTAQTARLRSSSSGEINIRGVRGEVEARGKDIRVAGRKVGNDDDN